MAQAPLLPEVVHPHLWLGSEKFGICPHRSQDFQHAGSEWGLLYICSQTHC